MRDKVRQFANFDCEFCLKTQIQIKKKEISIFNIPDVALDRCQYGIAPTSQQAAQYAALDELVPLHFHSTPTTGTKYLNIFSTH